MLPHTDNKEVTGDNQDKSTLKSFDQCKYLDSDWGKGCRYKDTADNCIFETCVVEGDEMPTMNKIWTFKCLICGTVTAVPSSNMKIMFCQACLDRIKEAENLPFTCRYCGRQQHSRSSWLFSRVCDSCIEKMNPNK